MLASVLAARCISGSAAFQHMLLLNEAACALRLLLPVSFVFSRNYLSPRSSSEGLGVGLPVGERPWLELGSAF